MDTLTGIGLRRDLSQSILKHDKSVFSFVELAPENWMGLGGHYRALLEKVSDQYPIFCHGLSLSLGSPDPLDRDFLKELAVFFDTYKIEHYSEHLSYCQSENAHLYDLLPIPFTEDAVEHVSDRIKEVQDILQRPIAIENVSYYTSVAPKMDELSFLSKILDRSGCKLLLDINNVYVNAFNHGYDPHHFIRNLPLNKVAYIHMAGHHQESESLIIDTHGGAIIDPVFALLSEAFNLMDPCPVLLERDYNFPDFSDLLNEGRQINQIITQARERSYALA